jgi:toluene monooxygenase system ferredoxin subunit
MTFRRAMATSDLWPGEMRGIVVENRKVLLVNVDGTIHAYADRCAHQAVELSEGRLEACVLTCRAHEWQYDVRTGDGINPRAARLVPYPVRVEGDDILVDTDVAADERHWVGPVLQAAPATNAIVAAILEENDGVRVVDRGSYVRVLARGRCILSRAAVERHLNGPFDLRADLEPLMSSFKGRFTLAEDSATWEIGAVP